MKQNTAFAVMMAGLLACGWLAAQDKPKDVLVQRTVTIRTGDIGGSVSAVGSTVAGVPHATYQFIAAGPALEGKVVKDAPFSADGVTETTRTLADGTKIQQKTTTKIYPASNSSNFTGSKINIGETNKDNIIRC